MHIMDAKSVNWSENYNTFQKSKGNDPDFKGGYPFWVGTTRVWCTNKLTKQDGDANSDEEKIKEIEHELHDDN